MTKKNKLKSFFILGFFFCVTVNLIAQNTPVNTSKWVEPADYKKEVAKDFRESLFSSIDTLDFVSFKSDVYIIGEGTESITAKRTIYPFEINKYELFTNSLI